MTYYGVTLFKIIKITNQKCEVYSIFGFQVRDQGSIFKKKFNAQISTFYLKIFTFFIGEDI